MQYIKRTFTLILLCVLMTGALTISAGAQSGGDVLVPGNPPLKKADVDNMVRFYEWLFDLKFTAEQRQRFQANTADEYRNDAKSNRASIDQISASLPKIFAKTPDEQGELRDQLVGDILEQATNGTDANSKLLVEIYNSGHGKAEATAASEKGAAAIGSIASLAGKWASGSSGSSTYSAGGSLLGSNGSRFTYNFSSDGAVEYTGIMNVMSAGCTMQVFKSAKGRGNLAGDTLTINWSPANFSRADSCSPSKDYKKVLPAETQTFKVRFRDAYGQKELCLTEKDEMCFTPTK